MPKFNLNPMKGVTLKEPVGWIRKTVNGRRVRQQVNFTDAVLSEGRLLYRENGKSYRISPFDIRYLANRPHGMGKWGEDLFTKSNKAGREMSKAEALDLITERFNLYMKYEGWKLPVAYIYSSKSRVVRGTENLMAVRLKDGSKGWLTAEGRFIGQDSIYQLMQGLDGTVASGMYDFSFADMWEKMSAQQRADFVDATKDVDWDAFWELKYNRDNPLSEKWLDAFDSVAEALLNVVG